MKYFILGLMLSSFTWAQKNDLTHRPKSFLTSGGKAVFVDFLEANYKITYNLNSRSAQVTATIKFDAPEAGMPLFDSDENPMSLTMNGEVVTSKEIKTPARETKLRIIRKDVAVGTHIAVITVPLKNLIEWRNGEVRNAFWNSDLMDRRFLERYMPASFEYDQVKMQFEVEVVGNTKSKYKVYSNGEVVSNGENKFTINFPEYFNNSSVFYHIIPEGASDEIQFTLKSVDGRDVPVTIYTIKPEVLEADKLKMLSTQIFHELEGDYGGLASPNVLPFTMRAVAEWSIMELPSQAPVL